MKSTSSAEGSANIEVVGSTSSNMRARLSLGSRAELILHFTYE